MATILGRAPGTALPEVSWRRMDVQVFVRADDDGKPTHVRFRFGNGDEHVAPIRTGSDTLRVIAEQLERSTALKGHCGRWFG